jgi:hypothetical protein
MRSLGCYTTCTNMANPTITVSLTKRQLQHLFDVLYERYMQHEAAAPNLEAMLASQPPHARTIAEGAVASNQQALDWVIAAHTELTGYPPTKW